MQSCIVILLLIFCFHNAKCVNATGKDVGELTDEDNIIYQRYLEMDKQLKKFVDQGVKSILPYVLEMNEHVNISSECMRNILSLTSALRKLKLWALNFVDATGKIPDGILSANTHMLGDFDQCLRISVLRKNSDLDFRGRYCLLQYQPIFPQAKRPIPLKTGYEEFINATRNMSDVIRFLAKNANLAQQEPSKFGLCIPSGCSKQDIGQVVKHFGEKILISASVRYCQIEGSVPVLNKRNVVIICIFSAILAFGVICSIVEYYLNKKGNTSSSRFKDILLCFSITSNFPKLMSTKTTEKNISCLHGIRVLSLFWVVLVHRMFSFTSLNISRHLGFRALDWIQLFFSQILLNGLLVVDVFFFIGGLIHSYVRVRKEKFEKDPTTKIRVGFIKIIIFRIWRLYPAYISSMLLLFLFVSRGPMVPLLKENFVQNCETNWWRNLLFIQNFMDLKDMCMGHSWYVSVDMQLFLVSLLPVALLARSEKKGLVVNTVFLFSGILISTVWHYLNKYPPTLVIQDLSNEQLKSFERSYFSPFPHVAPYFVGIFLGNFLAKKKERKLSIVYQVIGWSVSALCLTSMLFMSKTWNSGFEYTRLESSFYFTFSRILFSLSVGWMIFCCATGHGGIINYILSMKVWVPLSKMSYTVYLVSPILQLFYASNLRSSSDMTEMIGIWQYMGDLAISYLLSLVLVVLVESPCIAMQKLMFQKKESNSELPAKAAEEIKNDLNQRNGFTRCVEANQKDMTSQL